MKISNAFPSKYLRAVDLQDTDHTLAMDCVVIEEIANDEKKPVLYFAKKEKGLVLNKTNSKIIAREYGDDTDNWEGKTVILYPAMVEFRGDMVEAIRVRIPKAPTRRQTGAAQHNEANPSPADADDEIPF